MIDIEKERMKFGAHFSSYDEDEKEYCREGWDARARIAAEEMEAVRAENAKLAAFARDIWALDVQGVAFNVGWRLNQHGLIDTNGSPLGDWSKKND